MLYIIFSANCIVRVFLQVNFITKIDKEHYLKGTLRKQSNKHQNSHKTLPKSDKITGCMPKTAVSPNFKAHLFGLAGPK